jgi:polysaccharide pyruvyl transferase WcaK-like protein
VTVRRLPEPRRRGAADAPRIGFFGLLGSGNLGNDASFEVMLTQFRANHPEAVLDAMCMGPERLRHEYGIATTPLLWSKRFEGRTSGAPAILLKVLGKGVDALRTVRWVRRHDAVIVPGMGVLENSLPLRATGFPYALFLLCASARLFGAKVALVNVGATTINQRLIRSLSNAAARLAFYRSYRDDASREAMRQRGIDTSHDRVHPDLVFGLETPPHGAGDARTVGVGLMAFYGGTDDRRRADEIHLHYVRAMTGFVRWLVDHGYKVRLLSGDSVDDGVVRIVLDDVRAYRPDLEADTVVAKPLSSLRDLIDEIALVGTVVAIRYHNIMAALKLGRPTIAVGYSTKHDALMANMGMPDFSLPFRSLDLERLIELFVKLQERSSEVRQSLAASTLDRAHDLRCQFAELSSLLLPGGRTTMPVPGSPQVIEAIDPTISNHPDLVIPR